MLHEAGSGGCWGSRVHEYVSPAIIRRSQLWKFIESFKAYPPVVHLEIPAEVKLEVARFVCLIPLAQMDFRLNISPEVTASDASTTGGGLTASVGLTGFGQAAAAATIRGDLPEPADVCAVLTVGLFDGIGALRVAADACQLPVSGHVSVEVKKEASRVLESKFPSTLFVEEGVEAVDDEMVRGWACRFSQASVVLLGAGPPCQGVSGLNSERRGALKDHRSCLFSHVRRVKELLKRHFNWAQVRYLVENVASMDDKDRSIMTEDYGDYLVIIDAAGVSLARRPRLYWCDWELLPGEGVHIRPWKHSGMAAFREVELEAQVDPKEYLQPGSVKASKEPFPTFTTSRPRSHPGRRRQQRSVRLGRQMTSGSLLINTRRSCPSSSPMVNTDSLAAANVRSSWDFPKITRFSVCQSSSMGSHRMKTRGRH